MSKLTHLDDHGRASMVDVSAKESTSREAVAGAEIHLSAESFALVASGSAPKGDVLGAARLAGIMAAKKTSDLIPLCHHLMLSHVSVEFTLNEEQSSIAIEATARTNGPTGVEMEALVAASISALTLYDMIKAVDRGIEISSIRLLSKSGGKSGGFAAPEKPVRRSTPGNAQRPARATPKTLSHETGPLRAAPKGGEREAFRTFMTSHQLRPADWAKRAGVPLNAIYAFLNGRARVLDQDVAEKLAGAAGTRVEAMFGR